MPQLNRDKISETLSSILLIIAIGLSSFALKQIYIIDNRVTALEKSGLTNKDGLDLWREIATVKERLASIPTSLPPQWFLTRVEGIEKQLDKLDQKLEEHRKHDENK